MKYSSLGRDKYSIMPPLRGVCSADDARTVENPSEVVVRISSIDGMSNAWTGTALDIKSERRMVGWSTRPC